MDLSWGRLTLPYSVSPCLCLSLSQSLFVSVSTCLCLSLSLSLLVSVSPCLCLYLSQSLLVSVSPCLCLSLSLSLLVSVSPCLCLSLSLSLLVSVSPCLCLMSLSVSTFLRLYFICLLPLSLSPPLSDPAHVPPEEYMVNICRGFLTRLYLRLPSLGRSANKPEGRKKDNCLLYIILVHICRYIVTRLSSSSAIDQSIRSGLPVNEH